MTRMNPVAQRDPLIYEFDTDAQEASYDAWLKAKVQKALNDPRPSIPHDEAMARIRRTIAAVAERVAQGAA